MLHSYEERRRSERNAKIIGAIGVGVGAGAFLINTGARRRFGGLLMRGIQSLGAHMETMVFGGNLEHIRSGTSIAANAGDYMRMFESSLGKEMESFNRFIGRDLSRQEQRDVGVSALIEQHGWSRENAETIFRESGRSYDILSGASSQELLAHPYYRSVLNSMGGRNPYDTIDETLASQVIEAREAAKSIGQIHSSESVMEANRLFSEHLRDMASRNSDTSFINRIYNQVGIHKMGLGDMASSNFMGALREELNADRTVQSMQTVPWMSKNLFMNNLSMSLGNVGMSEAENLYAQAAFSLKLANESGWEAIVNKLPTEVMTHSNIAYNTKAWRSMAKAGFESLANEFTIPVTPGFGGMMPFKFMPWARGGVKDFAGTLGAGSFQRELYEALPPSLQEALFSNDRKLRRDAYYVGSRAFLTLEDGHVVSSPVDWKVKDARFGFQSAFRQIRQHGVGEADTESGGGFIGFINRLTGARGLQGEERSRPSKFMSTLDRAINPQAYPDHPLTALQNIINGSSSVADVERVLHGMRGATHISSDIPISQIITPDIRNRVNLSRGLERLIDENMSDRSVLNAALEIDRAMAGSHPTGYEKYFSSENISGLKGLHTKITARRLAQSDIEYMVQGNYGSASEKVVNLANLLGEENPLSGYDRLRDVFHGEVLRSIISNPNFNEVRPEILENASRIGGKAGDEAISRIWQAMGESSLGASYTAQGGEAATLASEIRNNAELRRVINQTIHKKFGATSVWHAITEETIEGVGATPYATPQSTSLIGTVLSSIRNRTSPNISGIPSYIARGNMIASSPMSFGIEEGSNRPSIGSIRDYLLGTNNSTGPVTPGALYHSAYRMNRMLAEFGIGLNPKDMQNTTDAYKSLLFKRVMPVYVGMEYWKYANHFADKHTGTDPDKGIANLRARAALGGSRVSDVLHLTGIEKKSAALIPGLEDYWQPRSYTEQKEYLAHGFDPVKRGRGWFGGSRTAFTGNRVQYWSPSWYRKEASGWQETSTADLNSDAYWCIHPEQSVIFQDGIKPIRECKVGDVVFSMDGSQGEVVSISKRRTTPSDRMLSITLYGKDDPVRLTGNHIVYVLRCGKVVCGSNRSRAIRRVLSGIKNSSYSENKSQTVRRHKNYEIVEIKASDIIPGDIVFSAIPTFPCKDSVLLSDLISGDYEIVNGKLVGFSNYGKQRVASCKLVTNEIPLSYEFGRVIGMFLSDGCSFHDQIRFYFSDTELRYAEEISTAFDNLFGLKCSIKHLKNMIIVDISSRPIAQLFSLFEKKENKHLPNGLLSDNEQYLLGIYTGFLCGDGSFSTSISSVTISYSIHSLLKIILLRLSIPFNESSKPPRITKTKLDKVWNRKRIYKLAVPLPYSRNEKLLLCDKVTSTKTKFQHLNYGFVGEYFYRIIKSVTESELPEEVYDLTITPHPSYLLDGFCVHNSHSLLPTPTHPLSPLKHFLDPYWWENKHRKDRPYVESGPAFDPNTIWGNALNMTIGRVVKPTKVYHPEYLQGDTGNSANYEGAAPAYANFTQSGGYSLTGGIPADALQGLGGRSSVGSGTGGGASGGNGGRGRDIVAGVNRGVHGGMGQVASALDLVGAKVPIKNGTLLAGPLAQLPVSSHNPIIQARRMFEQYWDISGIYGYSARTIAESLGIRQSAISNPIIATPERAYGLERRYWDRNLGGTVIPGVPVGGDLSEFIRRVIPHRDRTASYYDPVPNTMPNWLPGDDYMTNFKEGDPYCVSPDTLVEVGELGFIRADSVNKHEMISHKGRPISVIAKRERPLNKGEKSYELKVVSLSGTSLKFSEEHPILVINNPGQRNRYSPKVRVKTYEQANKVMSIIKSGITSQKEIASIIGVCPETVSKIYKRLSQDGKAEYVSDRKIKLSEGAEDYNIGLLSKGLEWVKIKNLKVGQYVAYPRPKFHSESVVLDISKYVEFLFTKNWVYYYYKRDNPLPECYEWLDTNSPSRFWWGERKKILNTYGWNSRVFEYAQRCIRTNKGLDRVDRFITVDNDMAYAFGLYLAEGSLSNACVDFSLHIKEKDIFLRAVRGLHNIHPSANYSFMQEKGTNGASGRFFSSIVVQLLDSLFGRGSKNKYIPDIVSKFKSDILGAFIRGYVDGDGCDFMESNSIGTPKYRISIKSANQVLLLQIRKLLLSQGIIGNLVKSPSPKKPPIYNGKIINSGDSWDLVFRGNSAYLLADFIGYNTPGNCPSTSASWSFCTEDYICLRVISVEEIEDVDTVIGFEVATDNSFCVAGVATHNTLIQSGEMRLPGEAYKKLHGNKWYSAIQRVNILSDVAPWSDEFKLSVAQARVIANSEGKQKGTVDRRLIREAIHRASVQKKLYELHDYKFNRGTHTERLTIKRIMDANTFMVEGSSHPIRLAGTRVSQDRIRKYLKATGRDKPRGADLNSYFYSLYGIKPGSQITAVMNADNQVSKDLLGTRHAAIYANGKNVNLSLIRSGVGRELVNDNSASGIAARFTKPQRAFGFLAEKVAHLDTPANCIAPHTQVITLKGVKRADQVKPGDEVLTSKGRFKKVVESKEQPSGKIIVDIKLCSSNIPITVTEDHPILGVKAERPRRITSHGTGKKLDPWGIDPHPTLILAGLLSKYDFIAYIPEAMPDIEAPIIDLSLLNTARFIVDKERVWVQGNNNSKLCVRDRYMEVTPELARLLGYYAAEGCIYRGRKGKLLQVIFTFSDKEKCYAEDVIRLSQIALGKTPRVSHINNTLVVVIGNSYFSEICSRYVGEKSNKKAPKDILSNNILRGEFIRGLLRGDGTKAGCARYDFIGMVALNLLTWLRDALFNLWRIPSTLTIAAKRENTLYGLRIGTWEGLAEFVDTEIIYSAKFFKREKAALCNRSSFDNFILYRIQEVVVSDYQGKTIDIEVEDDDTFSLLNASVHNTKFFHIRSALEEYKRGQVYGTNSGDWGSPYRTWIRPTMNAMAARNPILAVAQGAFIGSLFGRTKKGKLIGAIAGGILGGESSIRRVISETFTGKKYIPTDVKKRRELEEYYDTLKYVKYSRLYRQYAMEAREREGVNVESLASAMEAKGSEFKRKFHNLIDTRRRILMSDMSDNSKKRANKKLIRAVNNLIKANRMHFRLGPLGARALMYREMAGNTLIGSKPGTPLNDAMSGLPRYERELAMDIATNGTSKEKREFFSLLSNREKTAIGPSLGIRGSKVPPKQSLEDYFKSHQLPDASWSGWLESVDLNNPRIMTAKYEKINPQDLGIYPQNEAQAKIESIGVPTPTIHGSSSNIQETISRLLSGVGVSDLSVNVSIASNDDDSESNADVRLERDVTHHLIKSTIKSLL